jgi:hypothetical protein
LLCSDEARGDHLMARTFNGTSDLIALGSPAKLNAATTVFSFSGWFMFTSNLTAARYQTIIVKNGSPGPVFLGGGANTNTLSLYFRGAGGQVQIDPTATFPINTWMQGGFTYNSATTSVLYINGAVLSSLGVVGAINAGAGTWQINAGSFPGIFADFAFWNAELSAAEMRAIGVGYARPGRIRPLSLIGWWNMDGLQSPEPDLSGNQYNGTLTGTTSGFGPPISMFTPRWPQFMAPVTVPTLMPQILL